MTSLLRPRPKRDFSPASGASCGTSIGSEAESRLRRSGYLALRDVSCDAHEGMLRLRGHLPSYYLKQLAQEIAFEVEGVRGVINQIEVIAPASRPVVGCDRATTGAGTVAGPR